jgi:hypothetical protein
MSLLGLAVVTLSGRAQPPVEDTTDTGAVRVAALPTDRELSALDVPQEALAQESVLALPRLLRPGFSWAGEWEPETDGVEITDLDFRVTLPLIPIYGPPPPVLTHGFSYTALSAPDEFGLPSSLYDFSLGASWVRPIHPQWMLRVMASAAFASDLNNTGSDAWQFRGGLFATYEWTKELQLLVGAFASGRDDLPVLPAAGAIWTPNPFWRVDLTMPRPRIAYLLAYDGRRQHWIYLGGGISGGTWAFVQDGVDDRLTYREWRVTAGWEAVPPGEAARMPGNGLKWEAEVGYVFGRQFEFDRRPDDLSIDGALLLRLGLSL